MRLLHTYQWQGPVTNLAPFGIVKRGDLLRLTSKDVAYIERTGDTNFKAVDPAKVKQPDPELIAITPRMTGAEREAAERLNREEKARVGQLANANDDVRRFSEAVRQMSYDELFDLWRRLEDRGTRTGLDERAPKQQLVQCIVHHRKEVEALPSPGEKVESGGD